MRITSELTDSTVLTELGGRIARARLDRNLTQAGLAHEAGISTPTLKRLERGQGSNLVLYGLVVAFLFAVTALYQRISHLEGQLTQLTRAIAILSADKAEPRTELREPVQ